MIMTKEEFDKINVFGKGNHNDNKEKKLCQ